MEDSIKIALPTGRLGDKIYKLFAKIGLDCSELLQDNRKLVFHNQERGVSYFLVKPSDVGTYVERGVADIGIIGKDVLLESGSDVYELCDLKTGICRIVAAARKDYIPDPGKRLTVATKYVNVTKSYYASLGREIEIIKLGGSIELAACLGLADVIVDIVETGSTLKENGLEVIAQIENSSARLIANKISFRFKNTLIEDVVMKLNEELKGDAIT